MERVSFSSPFQDIGGASEKHLSWQLRCETPARPVSTPRRSSAPFSANSSSQSGTIWIVLVRDAFPGATEQNQKYFHSSGEQCILAMLNREWTTSWETLRGGYMPPKHLPCFTGSVTISGPSCLPHLPDNNAKGRQWGGGGETEPLFQTTEFHLNLNTASFHIETGIQWAAWATTHLFQEEVVWHATSPRSYAVKHLNN